MKYTLVIAEKPSVAQSIAAVIGATKRYDGYLEGSDYIVSWCVGHLVELSTADSYDERYAKWQYADLPIIPENWQYSISRGKEKQMKIIKELMHRKDVNIIIAATDAGREGELIFRLVYEKNNCNKPVKRLWISSMEEKAISDGFQNLRDGKHYDNLYHSALCRAKADWIVGINSTRLFSVLYGQTLNVGRVMSPTLSMIVEREASISTFVAEPFYTVQLDCGVFTLSCEKLADKQMAKSLCESCDGQNIIIQSVENKEKSEKPPKLYDLTTLQREANRKLGFTAEQTLSYTQSLYEKKLVTYPRTDSRYLTSDISENTPPVIKAIAGLFTPQDTSFTVSMEQVTDNSKVNDHHAIIPTTSIHNCDIASLPFGEREILLLISLRLLCAVGEDCIYEETIVKTNFNNINFTAKGKTIITEGFHSIEKLSTSIQNEKMQAENTKVLPKITEGEIFQAKATVKEGKTSPPKHFTDDTILAAMENANKALIDIEQKGIGTPATRAGILEKLIKTGLLERKGDKKIKYFFPTPKGVSLITVLPEAIQSPQLTAEWEEKLNQIEHGELSPDSFLQDISQMVDNLVKTYEPIKGADVLFPSTLESIGKCPRCSNDVVENKKGFCCLNKSCSFALWKENKFFISKKKSLTKAVATELLKNSKVKLTGCYSEKTGKTYDAIVLIDDTGGKYVNFKMEFPTNKQIRKGR
jgi:DNA topoisomerase-3